MDSQEFMEYLESQDIHPRERMGQHFLVDQETLEFMGSQVRVPNVIEVGAGPGNLTEHLAGRAARVVAIELDRQFQLPLEDLMEEHPNVEVVYGDALRVDFDEYVEREDDEPTWQVVANLPFHISEPFVKKLSTVDLDSSVLMVGDRLADSLAVSDPSDSRFSRQSFLAQTFFEVENLKHVGKEQFYPVPRTDSDVVSLTPRESGEYASNPRLLVARRLFQTEHRSPTVEKVLSETNLESLGKPSIPAKDQHRVSRRRNKQEMRRLRDQINSGGLSAMEDTRRFAPSATNLAKKLNLPQSILSSPFSKLDNEQIRVLATALSEL
jgi:16S rRNA A1518/A1519 N6-dimethyltransferase RsmA/KsgA/DIM1 with predicted DNA glycosylase/AP lyase activity